MRCDARRDAMRCSGWKEDAGGEGRRLSKDECWTREGTNGGWNCALDLGRGRDGGTGSDDFGSEQEEKVERLCGDGMG